MFSPYNDTWDKASNKGLDLNEFSNIFLGKTENFTNKLLEERIIKYSAGFRINKVHHCPFIARGCRHQTDKTFNYMNVSIEDGIIKEIICFS